MRQISLYEELKFSCKKFLDAIKTLKSQLDRREGKLLETSMNIKGMDLYALPPFVTLKFSYRSFMILARRNVEIENRPTFKQQFLKLASKGHK